ncbi:hypothetical protein Tco_0103169 [Tanacetum coccineum]
MIVFYICWAMGASLSSVSESEEFNFYTNTFQVRSIPSSFRVSSEFSIAGFHPSEKYVDIRSSIYSHDARLEYLVYKVFECCYMGTIGAYEQAQQRLLWPRHFVAHGHGMTTDCGGCRDVSSASQFEDSCAIRGNLRKAYEKCNNISQESRALICMFLKESSEKDHKLDLSMYGKAAQLGKQMDAICPLTEKELHQLRMDEEALKEMLEEEAMNKKALEEKSRQEQVKNDAFFLEFGVVRYDSEYESSD